MDEKGYLRELAWRYADIAARPVMRQRADLWRAHNAMTAPRPVLVMEMRTFEAELLPPLRAQSAWGREMELELLRNIVHFERIGDDKVVPPHFDLEMDVRIRAFDMDARRTYATDAQGRQVGYHDRPFLEDLARDLPKLRHSTWRFDRARDAAREDFARDVLADILPIQRKNKALEWFVTPSQHIVNLMGMEALMYALYDEPEAVRALYDFVCEDILGILSGLEEAHLLTPNNGHDYAGAGSYGLTDALHPTQPIQTRMMWGNMNSQETVSVSPAMYKEFAFPVYERLARAFGMVYYGCCEPVHALWDECLMRLPNLRKISISPWCDEEAMGERLRGGGVIYSRKPSPNFVGTGAALDEEGYRAHIEKTLRAARGCGLEIIHRDVYTLGGHPEKPARAIRIAREAIEAMW